MKPFLTVLFFVFLVPVLHAQHNVLSVGNTIPMTIKSGTVFSADSLVLTPSSNFTLASNAILETPVAVPGLPTSSINRVYYLNSGITFSGTIQIYYQISELNGNAEGVLNYADSTPGNKWLVSAGSTVNMVSHYVQQPALSRIFSSASAAQTGTLLPLKLVSFAGAWIANQVALTWVVDQNEDSRDYTLESSTDGQNWQTDALVPSTRVEGQYDYHYNYRIEPFVSKSYRILITELSGHQSYSQIIKLDASSNLNNLYIVGRANGATLHFLGTMPSRVRVLNALGQTIWVNNSSSFIYELRGLVAGLYFVQYETGGKSAAKEFVVK